MHFTFVRESVISSKENKLKILFICGCLEPGKDGVGDYCYQLSSELSSLGTKTLLLSWNDRWVFSPQQKEESLFRLPQALTESEKLSLALDYIKSHEPDIISIQYVPYAFHPKGLSFSLRSTLRELAKVAPIRHWMSHETWIGIDKNSSLKDRCIGWIQKQLLRNNIEALNPQLIHTSNSVYSGMLSCIGQTAQLLPLCSNINPHPPEDANTILEKLGLNGWDRAELLIAGVFGNIPNEWDIEFNLSQLSKWADKTNKQPVCLFLGKPNQPDSYFTAYLDKTTPKVIPLGPKSEKEISQYIQFLDFGFATTPSDLVGKSGSTQAMLTHGVPVVLSRTDWHSRYPVPPNLQADISGLYHLKDYGTKWTECDLTPFATNNTKQLIAKTLKEQLSKL